MDLRGESGAMASSSKHGDGQWREIMKGEKGRVVEWMHAVAHAGEWSK